MRIHQISDIGPEITLADIEAVESVLAAQLPVSYRDFLLKHNGGVPDPCYFHDEVLSRFYSIRAPKELDDLLANHGRMREWLPAGVIPIAADAFGNEVCLAIKGENRDKVYFWDHEGGTPRVDIRAKYPEIIFNPYEDEEPRPPVKDDWPGHPDLTLIADSFDEFLDSFHDDVPESSP